MINDAKGTLYKNTEIFWCIKVFAFFRPGHRAWKLTSHACNRLAPNFLVSIYKRLGMLEYPGYSMDTTCRRRFYLLKRPNKFSRNILFKELGKHTP